MQLWPHVISVGAVCCEARFCASQKAGMGGGEPA